jgi:MFS family permease
LTRSAIRFEHYNHPVISKLFKSSVPGEYRANFIHLYFDMGWYGVLAGSSINFLKIYAARLGGNGFQIGMLDASAALVGLSLAIPAGHWIVKRHIGRTIFWTSVVYRIGFLLWVLLPWLFTYSGQVWALIVLAFLMAIPLTPLSVGFNALFAASVPDEYRAHVAGIRNILLSVSFILTSLGCGYLLEHLAFPTGYQFVFAIGFFGAAMSSLHLYFVRPLPVPADITQRPVELKTAEDAASAHHGRTLFSAIRADIWSTHFRNVLLVMMGFHLAQYLALPLFPLYQVNQLHLTDEQIGNGSAIFYLIVLLGSTQLRAVVHKIGNRMVTAIGVIGMGFYPFIMAFSRTPLHFYGVSAMGGLSWALVGGAYANYMLERIPAHDRPAYLAWYNVILNASILTGSLLGPLIASQIGLVAGLFVFAAARFLAGIAIWKWG